MKVKILLVALVCIVLLGGCNTAKEEVIPMIVPDLSTEEGIREYLVGDWVFDKDYLSSVVCNMSIDQDLNIDLSFENPYEEGSKEDFSGHITLDRQYAEANEAPDIIAIELVDTDWPGGDYFFIHRTAYDGKFVMSWFFAGNGDGIFGKLDPYDSGGTPEEIMLEKVIEGTTQLTPVANEEFHAVFWGRGENEKSLWLDDVDWELKEYTGETILIDDEEWALEDWEEFNAAYPQSMTLYENEVKESVLYNINLDETDGIWSDELFPGVVYLVKTDKNGDIISLIEAEYSARVLESSEGRIPSAIEKLALDILENDYDEVKYYLENGMKLFFTGETFTFSDGEYYEVILGEKGEEGVWTEKTYAVNTITRQVYYYDEYSDDFELLGLG